MSSSNIIISILERFGFFDIILPFILIYAVIYGILAKTQILGNPFDQDIAKAKFVRSLISLISLSIAFLTVGAINVITKLKILIPHIVLYLLSIFLLIISVAAFYLPLEKVDESEYRKYRKFILIVSIIIFSILTLSSLGIIVIGSIEEGIVGLIQSEIFVLIVILLIIFLVIYWLTRGEIVEKETKQK
ncbi:MAG: hypothetical protein QXM04_02565 [Nanopusillaceae archaeon]